MNLEHLRPPLVSTAIDGKIIRTLAQCFYANVWRVEAGAAPEPARNGNSTGQPENIVPGLLDMFYRPDDANPLETGLPMPSSHIGGAPKLSPTSWPSEAFPYPII